MVDCVQGTYPGGNEQSLYVFLFDFHGARLPVGIALEKCNIPCMTGKAPKRPRDTNQLAKSIVDIATGDVEDDPYEGKDPAAVELGRRGGLKGGKARASMLTPKQRREIAQKAAAARWGKNDGRNSDSE